jgi:integrase
MTQQLEKSYWKTHKYQRHSVEKDVKNFCGWDILLKLVEACKNPTEKALVSFLFETGGRVSEVLSLKTDMFSINESTQPPIIIVSGMPLRKRYQKISEYFQCSNCKNIINRASTVCSECGSTDLKRRYRTELKTEVRNDFSIRTDEPLAQIMLQHLKEVKETHDLKKAKLERKCSREKRNPTPKELSYLKQAKLLFLNPQTMKPFSRKWSYNVLRRAGDQIGEYFYNHRLRSERASHLGQSLKAESLLEWFTWEKWETAKVYARKGPEKLAEEMGVKIKENGM